MLRAPTDDLVERLGRLFYPATIAAVVAVLIAVEAYLPTQFAVFGLYALVGLVGGAMIHYGTDEVTRETRTRIDRRFHRGAVYAVVAVTVGAVALTGAPLVVAVGLVVGYALVARQLLVLADARRLVPQITALYLLSPVTKYLTAGYYIGHGDLLFHTRLAESVVAEGSLAAIAGETYYDFPGLHLLSGTVSSLSGLGAHDGITLVGLAAYATLLPAVYLITARVTDDPRLGLATALAAAALDDLSFYASYVFPQALAIVLILALVLLALLAARDRIARPAAAAFVLVAVALVFTHHLTEVLFVPVLGLVAALYASHGREYATGLLTSRGLALFAFAGVLTTVRLYRTGFLGRLADKAGLLVRGGARGGHTQSLNFAFGIGAAPDPVVAAFRWLASPYGVYLVVLLLVFSIGVVAFLRAPWRPVTHGAVAWAGIAGAIFVFETPISIQSLIRIRAPWLFVFAFVVAIGFRKLRRHADPARTSRLLLLLLVVLCAAGPLVTADNYYGLDPRPTTQNAFSDAEYEQLRAVSSFVEGTETPTTVFWYTRLAMERFRVTGAEHATIRGESLVVEPGHLLYRRSWTDHEVFFSANTADSLYSHRMRVSDGWLDERLVRGDKVYSAGEVGLLWSDAERSFRSDRPPT